MNLLPTTSSARMLIPAMPVATNHTATPSAVLPPNRPARPIVSVESAIEEAIDHLRRSPSHGLSKMIASGILRKVHERSGLMCEIALAEGGRAILCFSETKEKLRRLMSRFRRNSRRLAQGVIVRVGDSLDNLRIGIANRIRWIYSAITNKAESPEIEERRRQRRIKRRWNASKNFQPGFA